MAIRAYNALRETKGGPFNNIDEAIEWAEKQLPSFYPIDSIAVIKEAFKDNGRTMLSENSDGSFVEDVVIFDDEKHEMDEDGHIDW